MSPLRQRGLKIPPIKAGRVGRRASLQQTLLLRNGSRHCASNNKNVFFRRAIARRLPPPRPGYAFPRKSDSWEGDSVSVAALTFAARFLGLSLVTWLVIILLVIVVAVVVSRRRV